ncbi:MAG: DsbA family oxidoreductase [Gemmatimonadaceae bacterium]|nr:DsbA family oxidoreductase [Gemmatimonadaceae bacterium]
MSVKHQHDRRIMDFTNSAAPVSTETPTLTVEVYADLVCPWCWIGERRLEAALEQLQAAYPGTQVERVWRPFQLDPTVPAEGLDWREFVESKFGGLDAAAPMFERVAGAGAENGLEFHFDRMTRSPNTVRGHALVVHAQQSGRNPWPLVEALYSAHFTQGLDLGDVDTLVRIASEHGIDANEAREVVTSGRYDVDVMQSQREAARLGIRGVPFVVLDGRFGVSGAQPVAIFSQALSRALTD